MSSKSSVVRWAAEKAALFFSKRPALLVVLLGVYLLSPFDVLPEALVGPVGYLDDLMVILLPLVLRNYLQRKNPPHRPKDYVDTTARPGGRGSR